MKQGKSISELSRLVQHEAAFLDPTVQDDHRGILESLMSYLQ